MSNRQQGYNFLKSQSSQTQSNIQLTTVIALELTVRAPKNSLHTQKKAKRICSIIHVE